VRYKLTYPFWTEQERAARPLGSENK